MKNLISDNGVNSLHIASIKSDKKCVKFLLEYGADINHQDRFGETAFHIATRESNKKW